METFVAQVCKTCYYYIHNINRIKHVLDYDSLEKLIHCFISSTLDYCNSLYLGLPNALLKKLQRVQNAAARILTVTFRNEHITPILFQLHWLPVEARIQFKILLFMHKCFYSTAPSYLCVLFTKSVQCRSMRSTNDALFNVPFTDSSLVFNRSWTSLIGTGRIW
jgi:hypothetical protein